MSPLDDPSRSGLYRAGDAQALAAAGRARRLRVAGVVLGARDGRPELFDALAAALEFPRWFGRNWDALEDCLTDLSWLVPTDHLLLVEGAERLTRDDAVMLCEVLEAASAFWRRQGRRFYAVIVGDPPYLGHIAELAAP